MGKRAERVDYNASTASWLFDFCWNANRLDLGALEDVYGRYEPPGSGADTGGKFGAVSARSRIPLGAREVGSASMPGRKR